MTFKRYTRQKSREDRNAILASAPVILLTNYVMLDLVLARPDERSWLVLDPAPGFGARHPAKTR